MVLPSWVVAWACGIALSLVVPGQAGDPLRHPLVWGGCSLGLAFAVWRLLCRSPVLAMAGVAFAGGIVHAARSRPGPPSCSAAQERPSVVRGRVVRGPDALSWDPHRVPIPQQLDPQGIARPVPTRPDGKAPRYRMLVSLETIDGQSATGRVSLSLYGQPPASAPGDLVVLPTTLRPPFGLANPGLPDARWMAAAAGIDFHASSSSDQVTVEQAGRWWGPRRLAFRLRQAMARAITAQVPEPRAALMRTLVLGERTGVDARVEEGFRAAGATHVLSVSGLHLAAIAGLLFWALRAAIARVPFVALRVTPGRVAAALALPVVGFYTLLTGEAVATERAALMAAVALGAELAGRPLSLASSVAAAALVLLVRSPLLLLDVSFQLSFASVMALAHLVPHGPEAPRDDPRWRRAFLWARRSCVASTVAFAVTGPLVAHHFGEVTPAAPIGNLALVPLLELAVLPLGLGGALLASVHSWLGAVPLTVAGWGAALALEGAELFRRSAPVLAVRCPNSVETLALVAGVALLLIALDVHVGAGRRRLLWAALACLALASTSLVGRDIARRASDDVRITFLDVGQGDAALIEGPRGFVALVDGGGTLDGSFDPGERVIEPYLRRRGIARVDLMVLSHPHPDHMNGLFRVLKGFAVGALWTSGDDGRNPAYGELVALARRRSVRLETPVTLTRDGLTLAPVGPWVGDSIAAPEGATVNDASLAVRVSYAGRSVLFSGDIEADGEAELVGRGALGLPIDGDVLKVPHHGSLTSSSAELLDAVRPSMAVMSLGRNNRFGFPKPEVVTRYHERAIRVFRTDHSGALTVSLHAGGGLETTVARVCR